MALMNVSDSENENSNTSWTNDSEDEWARPIVSTNDTTSRTSLRSVVQNDVRDEAIYSTSHPENSSTSINVIVIRFQEGGTDIAEETFSEEYTVEFLKCYLEDLDSERFTYSSLSLYYHGKCMIDPLSLSDISGLEGPGPHCVDVCINN